MKQQFVDKLSLSQANTERLEIINSILEEYRNEGYRLTLRQLYYQLVSRDVIPNKQTEYSKLSTLLVKGRMAGVVDWDIIEDRLRQPYLPYHVEDIEDAISDTKRYYRLDRQKGQDVYIEIWVEKDALSGVLRRVSEKYHIRLMVNRGYSSCSAMYDAFERFNGELNPTILYLGDHDPSGLDMIRDIRERLAEFGVELNVIHLAITSEQIEKYSPPPNPAKVSDPRADRYIKNFGRTSREVDALPPKILISTVESCIKGLIDMVQYEEMLSSEKEDKEKLQNMIDEGVFNS